MKASIEFANKIAKYPSSLLVPEKVLSQSRLIEKRFGGFRNFLKHAVVSKHWIYGLLPRLDEARILYQEKGQNLKKIGFRPYDGDWERFRLLAMKQRVSMTRLFILLVLYWDSDSGGVPTKPPVIVIKQSLATTNSFIYLRINRLII